MARIADYLELITLDVVRRPERPAYVKMARKAPPAHAADPGPKATGVYFGSVPDYSEEGPGDGVKLSGVTEGGPADKAGVKAGDVVIRFGGLPVRTIDDYIETLFRHRPGDKVDGRGQARRQGARAPCHSGESRRQGRRAPIDE